MIQSMKHTKRNSCVRVCCLVSAYKFIISLESLLRFSRRVLEVSHKLVFNVIVFSLLWDQKLPGVYIDTPIFKVFPLFLATSSFIAENGTKSALGVRRSKEREMHFPRRTVLAARYGHYFSVSRFLGAQPPLPTHHLSSVSTAWSVVFWPPLAGTLSTFAALF